MEGTHDQPDLPLRVPAAFQGREEGRSQGREEGREEGRAEGRAEDIVRILERRGVSVPQEAREQILSCTDIATLDNWLDRALTAAAVSDLFAPEASS